MAVIGGIEILNKKVKKALDDNINPDEKVLFCIVGAFKQPLIALDNRFLMIKTGFMADAAFGVRVGSFMYKDITGIETHVKGGVSLEVPHIEILTASYSAKAKKEPAKELNCLPFDYRQRDEYIQQVKKLEALVSKAKNEGAPVKGDEAKDDMVSQSEKLIKLHRDGILTEEEFKAAKKRLIE